jgi:hypothetical protein
LVARNDGKSYYHKQSHIFIFNILFLFSLKPLGFSEIEGISKKGEMRLFDVFAVCINCNDRMHKITKAVTLFIDTKYIFRYNHPT